MTEQFENMTGSEIGRIFAPETIKDREGWGRKTLKAIKSRGQSVYDGLVTLGLYEPEPVDTGPDFTVTPPVTGYFNQAQELLQSWFTGASGLLDPHRYKAPHAPRGTPPRPHFPRHNRRIRLFHI